MFKKIYLHLLLSAIALPHVSAEPATYAATDLKHHLKQAAATIEKIANNDTYASYEIGYEFLEAQYAKNNDLKHESLNDDFPLNYALMETHCSSYGEALYLQILLAKFNNHERQSTVSTPQIPTPLITAPAAQIIRLPDQKGVEVPAMPVEPMVDSTQDNVTLKLLPMAVLTPQPKQETDGELTLKAVHQNLLPQLKTIARAKKLTPQIQQQTDGTLAPQLADQRLTGQLQTIARVKKLTPQIQQQTDGAPALNLYDPSPAPLLQAIIQLKKLTPQRQQQTDGELSPKVVHQNLLPQLQTIARPKKLTPQIQQQTDGAPALNLHDSSPAPLLQAIIQLNELTPQPKQETDGTPIPQLDDQQPTGQLQTIAKKTIIEKELEPEAPSEPKTPTKSAQHQFDQQLQNSPIIKKIRKNYDQLTGMSTFPSDNAVGRLMRSLLQDMGYDIFGPLEEKYDHQVRLLQQQIDRCDKTLKRNLEELNGLHLTPSDREQEAVAIRKTAQARIGILKARLARAEMLQKRYSFYNTTQYLLVDGRQQNQDNFKEKKITPIDVQELNRVAVFQYMMAIHGYVKKPLSVERKETKEIIFKALIKALELTPAADKEVEAKINNKISQLKRELN